MLEKAAPDSLEALFESLDVDPEQEAREAEAEVARHMNAALLEVRGGGRGLPNAAKRLRRESMK